MEKTINVYNWKNEIVATFPTDKGFSGSTQARDFCLENFENYGHQSNEELGWHYKELPKYDPQDRAEYIGNGFWS